MTTRRVRTGTCIMAATLLGLAGCLQIETTVTMEADGSATVTERVRVVKYLLDLDAHHKGSGPSLAQLLGRPAAEKRAAKMGGGVTLVSHKVGPAEKGSLESITVFKRPELDGLEYMSPLLAHHDYPNLNRIRFKVSGITKPGWWDRWDYGDILVQVQPLTAKGKVPSRLTDLKERPPAPTPKDVQTYRNLAPVFRDLMKDFHVRLRFQTYGPTPVCIGFRGHTTGPRNARAGVDFGDILSLSHADLDQFGGKFLENEEVMLGIVRGDLRVQAIVDAVKNGIRNNTVPLLIAPGFGPYQGWSHHRVSFWFPPSRPLFDRYFKGKTLVPRHKDRKSFPARWEDIGYQPKHKKSETGTR